MIFGPDMTARILLGEKTETRRVASPGVPCRYRPGRTYAVQPGRGLKGAFRVLVTAVERVPLDAMTEADARAEGFGSLAGFRARWAELHRGRDVAEVWRIVFEVA